MPLPMPQYNVLAAHVPTVSSCQAGSHLAAPNTHQLKPHMSPGSPEWQSGAADRPFATLRVTLLGHLV